MCGFWPDKFCPSRCVVVGDNGMDIKYIAKSDNVPGTVVKRDVNGDFSANRPVLNSLQVGNTYFNIMEFNVGETPTYGYLIQTNIPFDSRVMFRININGVNTSSETIANISILFYTYYTFFSMHDYTNTGSWDPKIVQIANNNGYVQIFLGNPITFISLDVNAEILYNVSGEKSDILYGWTISDALPNSDHLTTLSQKTLATDIVGTGTTNLTNLTVSGSASLNTLETSGQATLQSLNVTPGAATFPNINVTGGNATLTNLTASSANITDVNIDSGNITIDTLASSSTLPSNLLSSYIVTDSNSYSYQLGVYHSSVTFWTYTFFGYVSQGLTISLTVTNDSGANSIQLYATIDNIQSNVLTIPYQTSATNENITWNNTVPQKDMIALHTINIVGTYSGNNVQDGTQSISNIYVHG